MHTENTEAIDVHDEREQGFTLIELLVVIIIIGILAAIAIPVFLNQRQRAHDAKVKSNIHSVAMALESKLTSDPTVTTLTMEDVYDEGGRINEDVIMSVTGGASGYCVQGYSPNGKQHVEGSPLRYDSSAGGFLADDAEGVDCASDGGGDMPTWEDSDGEVPSWDAPSGSGGSSGNTPPPWVSGGGSGGSGGSGTRTMSPIIAPVAEARFVDGFDVSFEMISKTNQTIVVRVTTTAASPDAVTPETWTGVYGSVWCQRAAKQYEVDFDSIPSNGTFTVTKPGGGDFCDPAGEFANNYPWLVDLNNIGSMGYVSFEPQERRDYDWEQ